MKRSKKKFRTGRRNEFMMSKNLPTRDKKVDSVQRLSGKNWKELNNKLRDFLWFWHLLAEFMHPWKFSKEKRVFGCKICHKWCHHRYQSFSAFTIEPRSHCSDKVQLRKYSWVNEALTQLPNVPIPWHVMGSNVHAQASLETHLYNCNGASVVRLWNIPTPPTRWTVVQFPECLNNSSSSLPPLLPLLVQSTCFWGGWGYTTHI